MRASPALKRCNRVLRLQESANPAKIFKYPQVYLRMQDVAMAMLSTGKVTALVH